MSHNHGFITVLHARDLRIAAQDVLRLLKLDARNKGGSGPWFPEDNFLEDLKTAALDLLIDGKGEETLLVPDLGGWSGEGSGRAYEFLQREVLTKLRGTADLLFVWEGGDSMTGLRVVEGEVTECEVTYALTPKGSTPRKVGDWLKVEIAGDLCILDESNRKTRVQGVLLSGTPAAIRDAMATTGLYRNVGLILADGENAETKTGGGSK